MVFMLSGTDCCGKNFVMHELSKSYNYQYFMSPRSPICNIVYDKIYKRDEKREVTNLNLISKYLELETYFILIDVDPKILVQRALARNEKHISKEEDFIRHIEVYNEVFDKCKELFSQYKDRFIKVDNSGDIKTTLRAISFAIGER